MTDTLDKAETPMDRHWSGHDTMLDRVRSSSVVTITPDVFEQMFLSPENRVKGDLRQTFGNPTAIGKWSEYSI